jgi:hypothetical protein
MVKIRDGHGSLREKEMTAFREKKSLEFRVQSLEQIFFTIRGALRGHDGLIRKRVRRFKGFNFDIVHLNPKPFSYLVEPIEVIRV